MSFINLLRRVSFAPFARGARPTRLSKGTSLLGGEILGPFSRGAATKSVLPLQDLDDSKLINVELRLEALTGVRATPFT